MTTFETVRTVIADELGLTEAEISPNALLSDMGDSLELASLMIELEEALNCEIPHSDLWKLRTVQDIVNYADQNCVTR